MGEEREKFIAGALRQGYTQELAEQVFALIEPFAGYAFNKAHSVSYALISYWTAYFKANYAPEYMACLLNAYAENSEKAESIISECKRLKIAVLPPDVLTSQPDYSIEATDDGESGIRVGLASVKNVGTGAVEEFVGSRNSIDGPVESIEELCRATDMSQLNRKTLESLIKAGAFDRFGDRGAILDSVDRILSVAQSEADLKSTDQTSMFDMLGDSVPAPLTNIELPNVETPATAKGDWEEELLGFRLSGNEEFDAMMTDSDGSAIISVGDLTAELAGKKKVINGQVLSSEERFTKNGKRFLIVKLTLLGGTTDVFVWENVLAETEGLWQSGTLVTLTVSVRVRDGDDRVSLSCQRAAEYVRQDNDQKEIKQTIVAPALPAPSLTLKSPTVINNGSAASTNGAAHQERNGGTASNGASKTSDVAKAPAPPKQLVIRVKEGADADKDRGIMDDLKRMLLEHQGDDEISLEIAVDGRLITMEWQMLKVRISEELERELKGVLGESGQARVREKATPAI